MYVVPRKGGKREDTYATLQARIRNRVPCNPRALACGRLSYCLVSRHTAASETKGHFVPGDRDLCEALPEGSLSGGVSHKTKKKAFVPFVAVTCNLRQDFPKNKEKQLPPHKTVLPKVLIKVLGPHFFITSLLIHVPQNIS